MSVLPTLYSSAYNAAFIDSSAPVAASIVPSAPTAAFYGSCVSSTGLRLRLQFRVPPASETSRTMHPAYPWPSYRDSRTHPPQPGVVTFLPPASRTSVNMASEIASSTVTSRPFACRFFDILRTSPLYGGGSPRRKVLTVDELRGCIDPYGALVNFEHPEYLLADVIPLHLYNPASNRHRGGIVVKVPYMTLVPLLGVDELRDLCRLHRIPVPKALLRDTLVRLLNDHDCVTHGNDDGIEGCETSYAVIHPRLEPMGKAYAGIIDVESDTFAASFKTLFPADLNGMLDASVLSLTSVGFRVKMVKRSGSVTIEQGDVLLKDIPPAILAKRMNVQGIRSLAAHHGVNLSSRWKKDKCIEALTNHRCNDCRSLYFVLCPITTAPSKKAPKSPWMDAHDQNAPLLWETTFTLPTEPYPPRPTTLHDMAQAMMGYCADLSPDAINESGCCVCGQLNRVSSLKPFVSSNYDLDLLAQVGCTRRERDSAGQASHEIEGPVVDADLTEICADCDEALLNGKRPPLAMANHLWLGKVPMCLKDLTLAEMALITRVRYNRCIVRVAKGHAKMVANVIAFEHPSKKIYDKLPVSKTELSEVLSILFHGAQPPSDHDLKRTPVLVRRDKVRDALEWLKLNNPDYSDLSIDYTVLDRDYAHDGIPVAVVQHISSESSGNVPSASKSVFETDLDVGTTEGPCPYSVNGLTAERFGAMTPTERKLTAMRYLKNGGDSLAVGHAEKAESMYDNPRLYSQMFPWLFPYGQGGLGHTEHAGKISRQTHIKWLLMYHDKRFQEDAAFLIIAFNHQLIRQSSGGSFLSMKRGNFGSVADEIRKLDPTVLQSISERLANGGRFFPQTPEEQRCRRLCDQVEAVGGHVDGSLARKKFQRSEIWSMIHFLNSPAWFITISPADSKHPLCFYLASDDVEFKPKIVSYSERLLKITRNPVACARFFDYLVNLFLKHICGWSDDGPVRGIFGTPAGYYGTVEQQGRMTLHLHLLLWIRGQLSLNVIRERVMADDSPFIQELTAYIESCMVGEFQTGSKDEVGARVPYIPDNEDRGIHTIMVATDGVPDGYVDPTLTVPEAPPDEFCADPVDCGCADCRQLLSWWERTKATIDDILFRSNVHTCFGRKDNKKSKKAATKEDSGKYIPKMHATGKGCINKDGICTARFPRPVFWGTKIDKKTGHIDPKKREAQMNDVNLVVTGCNRCNTDVRCLMSGTSVKAIVGYVTDYITKGWLKTHQVFATMYEAFTRNEKVMDESEEQRAGNGARKMIMKIVNSLSAKMEIGAPMAAMYLLQNPDHYTSHQFVPFYWKNYFNYVQNQWTILYDNAEPSGEDVPSDPEDVGVSRVHDKDALQKLNVDMANEFGVDPHSVMPSDVGVKTEVLPDDTNTPTLVADEPTLVNDEWQDVSGCTEPTPHETVRMTRSNGYYMAKSNTDDYRNRPVQMKDVCLYDFIQCSVKHPIKSSRSPRQDLQWFELGEDHPQANTHAVALDPERRSSVIPNFIGPSLPRKDVGDREDYCCTMLTLFCPWTTGIDLKSAPMSWEDRFNSFEFTTRQRDLMDNFNMRYECYDARDDYTAILKSLSSGGDDEDSDDEDDVYADNGENDEDDDDELEYSLGSAAVYQQGESSRLMGALRRAGWKASGALKSSIDALRLPSIVIDTTLRSAAWNNIVKVEKLRAWKRKLGLLASTATEEDVESARTSATVQNDAFVVPSSYLSKDFIPSNGEWGELIQELVTKWKLNPGQEKAFRIVANHGCCVAPEQLLMHLGGMGGTGKSTVIQALCDFFTRRGEQFRFVLLGPTGTAAALIGGSTYHSFLGLNTGRTTRGEAAFKVEEVRERLTGVGYILLDELSMLDCRALCAISARCCEALGVFEKPFGGLNVILCGDFAQLPPVNGQPLYSRKVALNQSARQSIAEQENTIGKLIWLQFTTVVILTENMRQTSKDPKEKAFRRALENLRWKSCTEADLELFRSRVAHSQVDLSVDAESFRDVSVITCRNMDKDHINTVNSNRFSTEHSSALSDFYSVDAISNAEPKRTDPKKKRRIYCKARMLTKPLQTALWNQLPCTSEQIPGKLSICRGMPVIIRYNDATELCMTRGQEARIVGWSSLPIPRHKGKRCLDVLYVELVNPPHSVKLPHLPTNVVPLTRNSQSVEAQLPNDEYVRLSRSQVPVLPNFAMTDYSSQGKTRPWNVVDLAECRSFQSVYTCLSRGISLAQTLIIREYDEALLTGQLDGALRQEYRELDHLSVITDLRYHGLVPPDIMQATRWETIDLYRTWKKSAGTAIPGAPVLFDDPLLLADKDYKLPEAPVPREHSTLVSNHKRKADLENPAPKRRRIATARPVLANEAWISPVGPIWDSQDWSCPFDVWTAIFYWLWRDDRVRWSRLLKRRGAYLCDMVEGFEGMKDNDPVQEITDIRNIWRESVRSDYPQWYPPGRRGADIMTLAEHLLNYKSSNRIYLACSSCTVPPSEPNEIGIQTVGAFTHVTADARSIQHYVDRMFQAAGQCTSCGNDVHVTHHASDILAFEAASAGGAVANSWIEVGDWGLYRLCGLVYYGDYHFICRVIGRSQKVYIHDGVEGGTSVFEGILGKDIAEVDLTNCRGMQMSLAIYALADRVPVA